VLLLQLLCAEDDVKLLWLALLNFGSTSPFGDQKKIFPKCPASAPGLLIEFSSAAVRAEAGESTEKSQSNRQGGRGRGRELSPRRRQIA
jgi:hypothetical protein